MERNIRGRVASGIRLVILGLMLSTIAPRTAEASLWCWLFGSDCDGGGTQRTTSQRAIPEIDFGTLPSAIALAAGGAAMLSDRVRRRR
jgi:hypothetical protein